MDASEATISRIRSIRGCAPGPRWCSAWSRAIAVRNGRFRRWPTACG